MASNFSLKGTDAVLAKIRRISNDITKKGARSAGIRAMRIARDAARAGARAIDDPATAEMIAKNVTARFDAKASRRQGAIVVKVGVMGGAKKYSNTADNRRARRVGKTYKTGGSTGNPGGDTWYWRLVEFGTSKMPARPFMRPALDRNSEAIGNAFVAELDTQIDKALAKGGR